MLELINAPRLLLVVSPTTVRSRTTSWWSRVHALVSRRESWPSGNPCSSTPPADPSRRLTSNGSTPHPSSVTDSTRPKRRRTLSWEPSRRILPLLNLFLVYLSCSCSCFLYGGGVRGSIKKIWNKRVPKAFYFCYEANEFHQGLGKTRLNTIAGKVIHRPNILAHSCLFTVFPQPSYSSAYINIHDHCSITENFLSC